MTRATRRPAIPVIALTGHLGAGKTTVLNRLLSRPGGRVGVVVNDFGAVNVDAGLVVGQIDEAASIAGGCICCLPDSGGLDEALARLADPRLRLDAIVVEASGAADPIALARLIRTSCPPAARPGGVIDVVDAVEHRRTVDTGRFAPARFAAASLVVVNKVDLLEPARREETIADIAERARERHPGVPVVAVSLGRVDPALVFDVASEEDAPDELPIAALLRAEEAESESGDGEHGHAHRHARAVTVEAPEPVDAGTLADLLEDPPPGAYRLKGFARVRAPRGERRYVVNVVGRQVHVAMAPASASGRPDALVAIGMDLDEAATERRIGVALAPASDADPASGSSRESRPAAARPGEGLRRLERLRRLSR